MPGIPRRRRARIVSRNSHITRKARKHRKSKMASGPRLRFEFTSPQLPAPGQDFNLASFPVHISTTTEKTILSLPLHLPRPVYKDINPDVLAAVDPDFPKTPIQYIYDGLEALGPGLFDVLTSVEYQLPEKGLPKELSINVNDVSSDMPSHMLAVYGPPPPGVPASKTRIRLFPSHNVILATHCANLPVLPSAHHEVPDEPGTSLKVPVIPFFVPVPELYTPLAAYLYTKRLDTLLQVLLPELPSTPLNVYAAPDETPEEAAKQREDFLSFATHLCAKYAPLTLFHHAMCINAFWRNVCALGIHETNLWTGMDFAWESLMLAMSVATGNIEQVMGKVKQERV